MAKLNFSLDGKLLSEFTLDKERITIGRRPTNDIHIDNLAVSGEHAIIITMGNDSFLEDLDSTNGTMVNQKLIKKHVLQNNDVIEFGKYQLKYLSDIQTKSPQVQNFASPELRNKPQTQAKQVAAAVSTQTATSAPIIAKLQVMTGENAGQEVLLNRAMIKLGEPGAQLAVITKRPHGFFLTHVEGNIYPVVNGRSIGMQTHVLNNQDV